MIKTSSDLYDSYTAVLDLTLDNHHKSSIINPESIIKHSTSCIILLVIIYIYIRICQEVISLDGYDLEEDCGKMSEWTFVTNHALTLASIAKSPDKTAREIGDDVGVTERTAHKLIMDLEEDGYITKTKVGIRNTYRIHPELPIKSANSAVGELLELLGWKRRKKPETEKK